MSVPVASETRSPLRASSEIRGVLGGGPESGGDQERADLVAVQAGGMGLVVDPRPPDVRGRGMVEQVFLDRVFVQPGNRGQAPDHSRPCPAGGFQVAGEQLDVSAAGGE